MIFLFARFFFNNKVYIFLSKKLLSSWLSNLGFRIIEICHVADFSVVILVVVITTNNMGCILCDCW